MAEKVKTDLKKKKTIEETMEGDNLTSLEDMMEQLEVIVGKLESEKLSLEESYSFFSKGMELVMKGNRSIDKVEKQMKILISNESEEI